MPRFFEVVQMSVSKTMRRLRAAWKALRAECRRGILPRSKAAGRRFYHLPSESQPEKVKILFELSLAKRLIADS